MTKNPKISKKWKFKKLIFRHFGALWLIFSKNECYQSIPRIKFSGWVFLVHVKSSFQCDFRAKKPVQKYEFLVIFWIFLHFKGLELILGKNGYDHWIPRLKLYYWVFLVHVKSSFYDNFRDEKILDSKYRQFSDQVFACKTARRW